MVGAAREGRLTVVGSGTLLPSAANSSSSFHLQVAGVPATVDGSARSVLVDCGSGTLHALARHGVVWESIDVVAASHLHGDHVGDLAALLGAWRYRGRVRPLTLVGPSDLGGFLERLAAAYGSWVTDPGFPLEVAAIGPDGHWSDPAGTLRIEAFPTPHTDTSVAFRVEGAWGTVGYTGDTGPSSDVAAFLRGCDVLVGECALPDPPPFGGHLTPSSLAALAREAGPGVLLVTHVYPPGEPGHVARDVRGATGGRVEPALPGTTARISPAGVDVDHPAPRE